MTKLRRVKRVHIAPDGVNSTFCRLQNGELIVNYASARPDSPWGFWDLKLVRSDDKGRTWSDPLTIVQSKGERNVMNHLGTTQLANGSIILPFIQSHSAGRQDSSANLLISQDDGHTWSDPIKLAPDGVTPTKLFWAITYGRVRELSDGTVIVPVTGQYPGERTWRNVLFCSNDSGRTWPEILTVAVGMDDEFDVIELPGKRMRAVFRDWRSPRYGHGASPLWESFSEDLGRTWSEPEITFQAIYGHSPAIFMTKQGTLICGYRYVGDLDRGICGVGFSIWDEVLNEWGTHHHVVDTVGVGEYRLGCGYPCWDYADDEQLLCVYHLNATYPGQYGFNSDIEGTFYIEES